MKGNLSILLATSALAVGITPAIAETSEPSSELNFSCQMSEGIPTTVARATDSNRTQPIFHWKQENIPGSADAQLLCDRVSTKLENYSEQGNDLSTIVFKGDEQGGLPAICATNADDMCTVLFTLGPSEEPIADANQVLTAILNKDLQANQLKTESNVRGVQSFSYKVSLLDLLGIGGLKFSR